MSSKYIHEKKEWEASYESDDDKKGVEYLDKLDRGEVGALFVEAYKNHKAYFKDKDGRSFKIDYSRSREKYSVKRR